MDVRYGLTLEGTFNISAPTRYGLTLEGTFNIIDGFPPVIINPYCLNQNDNVITTLDSYIKIGASNIYDEHSDLDKIEYKYGINDPAVPITYTDNAPVAGPNSYIFDGALSFNAGDIIYYKILATDTGGNTADTGTLAVVVEGIPTRYGLILEATFNITGEVPEIPIAAPIYMAINPVLAPRIQII